MASNINSTSIDATYPVAGQDNNSQGFRDNFNIIKSNFATAKTEIETLQTDTAKKNTNNNFAGNEINGALFRNNYIKQYSNGTKDTDFSLSVTAGNFQTVTIGADVTITLDDWSQQNNALESVVVSLVRSGGARSVTWATNGGTIKKTSDFDSPVTLTSTVDPLIVEFFTYDKGSTVFARKIGQFS